MPLYTFLDLCGGKVIFHPNEGHLYGSNNNKQTIKCDYYKFSLTRPTSDDCVGKPGESGHNHMGITRDSLEYAILCWGCLLRHLSFRNQETVKKSVEFVVSDWPHKLPIPGLIKRIINEFSNIRLQWCNLTHKKKLLSDFGDDKYQEFRTFLVKFRPTYWSDPVLIVTKGNPC